ncbi:hypothetical protein M758_UG327200 [Ceratodon purpureus]|nr:hypothetical protein M758_UG327200 [Ceratodon purpureus]
MVASTPWTGILVGLCRMLRARLSLSWSTLRKSGERCSATAMLLTTLSPASGKGYSLMTSV